MRALTVFVSAAVVYWALSRDEGTSDIQSTIEWMTWKVVASLSVVVALALGLTGAVTIFRTFGPERADRAESGAAAQMSTLAAPLSEHRSVSSLTLWLYGVGAVCLVAGAFAFVSLAPGTAHWPASLHVERSGAVAVVIGLSGVPWLVMVWLLQRHFADHCSHHSVPSIADLRRLWDLINAIVLAFAVFVVLALVTTGALRVAYFAGDKDPAADKQGAEFPSSAVLLYGAYFAILLLTIALPMVNAYRSAAADRVRATCALPEGDAVPDTTWKAKLDTVEELLHLNIGVLRSPITALTVFTPLITAALAAYIPEIAA